MMNKYMSICTLHGHFSGNLSVIVLGLIGRVVVSRRVVNVNGVAGGIYSEPRSS